MKSNSTANPRFGDDRLTEVPDRWIPCPRRSLDLIGDIFIASKTFLDEKFDNNLSKGSMFHPNMIKSIENALNVKIGLIIDLNNSKRFYDGVQLQNLQIAYIKIACVGVHGAPNRDQVITFVEVVKNFLLKYPLEKILVHCTHGFNRTGYMIISYLIEDQGWDVISGLTHFADQRPPGIYKDDYISALLKNYTHPKDKVIFPTPPLPKWCNVTDKQSTKKSIISTANDINPLYKFPIDDPLIEIVIGEDSAQIKTEICSFFNFKEHSFPGCQPVSLSRTNIQMIMQQPYLVSWKADGTRFFMYIKDRCMVYMVDREFNIIHIPHLTFPSSKGFDSHIKNTILDGEFVIENDNGVNRPRYLIFDLVIFNNEKVNLPFSKRLKLAHQEVIAPRDFAFSKGILNRAKEAFSVRLKQFFEKNRCRQLYERFMQNVTHETDGLVFQPENDMYVSGTCEACLKWKPDHLNTVDFYLNIQCIKREGCLNEWEGNLYVMGHDTIFAKIKVDGELRKYDKRIIECNYDKEVKRWKFLRVREDKYTPNWITTALSVCATIQEPVTIEDVYKAVGDSGPVIVCSSHKRKHVNDDVEPTVNVE